ncbi:hypothetical protein [Alkalispirochaeta alkalica]|uniref:hypothetical protein n=1 Tax=Alkalispirochaeta alkalica TaxID=46356 RepID=UPI0014615A2B|nr:hypothetical protein [Alkalispirochaeta alkalica]
MVTDEKADQQEVHTSRYLHTAQSSYKPGEQIKVFFKDLPGYKQDWITLINKDAPTNQYGQWFYTEGQRSGSHTFSGLSAGVYEVRLYFNWPDGQFHVQDRLEIVVN